MTSGAQITPLESLAFSMHSNRGLYGLLLGSGISSAAGIPTGWEITCQLIERLRAQRGEDDNTDALAWFEQTFNREPDYSFIVGNLGLTLPDRRGLLREFIEATPEEIAEGAKQPTSAHEAVANLVADGFIKVIVTTNIDRLIENALTGIGIEPTVLSSTADVLGSQPLDQIDCCVIKVHGDYRGHELRNVESELSEYPVALSDFLRRIFDEYGMVVSGWSATWDHALRSTLVSNPARRYATYWTVIGEPSDAASRVISHRDARTIPITDADTFFSQLKNQVLALDRTVKAHPLSIVASVERLKSTVVDPIRRIELADLISDTTDRTAQSLRCPLPETGSLAEPLKQSPQQQLALMEWSKDACSQLLAMAPLAGHYAAIDHAPIWTRALSMLVNDAQGSPQPERLGWKGFPATMLMYSLAIGAVISNNFGFLSRLLIDPISRVNGQDIGPIPHLLPSSLFSGLFAMNPHTGQITSPIRLPGKFAGSFGMNQWLHDVLRPLAAPLIVDEELFSSKFDIMEALYAITGNVRFEFKLGGLYCANRKRANRAFDEIHELVERLDSGNSPVAVFGTDDQSNDKWKDSISNLIERIN